MSFFVIECNGNNKECILWKNNPLILENLLKVG